MKTRTVYALMLGGAGATVVAVCLLAIALSHTQSQAPDDPYAVVIKETDRIRSAGAVKGPRAYSCKADAETCARAAVQEICGDDEFEITFRSVDVGTDGKNFDGEWAYRCLRRSNVL